MINFYIPFRLFTRGFTLVELLVVIALLAILATIAIPNFATLIANNRATAAANDLLGAMFLARSEAVKLNNPMVITPNGGNWAAGWSITRNDVPVRTRGALARVTIAAEPAFISFGPAGNANPPAFTFTVTAIGGGNPSRCVSVIASGNATAGPCPE